MGSKTTSTQSCKPEIAEDTKVEQVPSVESLASPAEIAQRAYEIFVAGGRAHGYDLEDWLQAEQELRRTAAANEKELR